MESTANPIAALYYGAHHWDFRLGNYLALLRTMAIRTMVLRLYDGTALRTETYSRLKRTRELIATLVVHGLDSELGQESLTRIRRAHERVTASNDEYKYVLSVFFLEPLRWNAQHGRQAFTREEEQRLFGFWMDVGQRMQIKDLDAELNDWRRFQQTYEAEHLGRSAEGSALACSSLTEVVRLVIPRGMQGLTRQTLLATMDPKVRDALALPEAHLPKSVLLATMRALSTFGAGRRVPTIRACDMTI